MTSCRIWSIIRIYKHIQKDKKLRLPCSSYWTYIKKRGSHVDLSISTVVWPFLLYASMHVPLYLTSLADRRHWVYFLHYLLPAKWDAELTNRYPTLPLRTNRYLKHFYTECDVQYLSLADLMCWRILLALLIVSFCACLRGNRFLNSIYDPEVSRSFNFYPRPRCRPNKYNLFNHNFHYDIYAYFSILA